MGLFHVAVSRLLRIKERGGVTLVQDLEEGVQVKVAVPDTASGEA